MIASLASCTKDGTSAPTPDAFDTGKTAYVKLAISMPKDASTRADGDLVAGTENEQSIKTISLALYNEFGVYVGEGVQFSDIEAGTVGDSEKPNVSNTYKQVFKLNIKEGADTPTQLVAFVNTPLVKENLDVVTDGFGTDAAIYEEADGVKKNFAMTNSGYYKDGKWVMSAPIDDTNIYHEQSQAASTPAVDIYVERLAAKVSVKNAETIAQKPDYLVQDINEGELKLEFTPTNWGVTGRATQEDVVKRPFENYKSATWVAGTNRSFWAEGTYYKDAYDTYFDATTGAPKGNKMDYILFGDKLGETMTAVDAHDTANASLAFEYTREHTTQLSHLKDAKNIAANTYAIVIGNYKVTGEHSDWFKDDQNNYEFYLLLAGESTKEETAGQNVYTAYTKSQLIGQLLYYNGANAVYTTEDNEKYTIAACTTPKAANAVKVEDPSAEYVATYAFDETIDIFYNGGKYYLKGKEGAEAKLYIRKSADEYELLNADNLAKLDKSTNARAYKFDNNGSAYFNAPIPHNVAETPAETVYGVVRNHHYVMTIATITSLGAPLNSDVFAPDDSDPENPVYPPILPDPDDLVDHFINAEIKVLAWHEKASDITL